MADMETSEKVPFLSNLEGQNLQFKEKNGFLKKFLWLQVGLLLLYTFISLNIIRTLTNAPTITEMSPIPHASTEYRPHLYENLNHNPFAGSPLAKPEIDESWRGLLRNINIRVSKNELESTKQTSVDLPEGGGYLAWMSVYHELHCLKVLRQWGYKDHYFPNQTKEEHGIMEMHTDHCIEYLRQSSMCHADTSLTTFEWGEGKSKPMLKSKRSQHMCRDWNAVETVAKDRAVGSAELSRLENPLAHEAI